MKKIKFKLVVFVAGICTIGLTACKKEAITPTEVKKKQSATATEKNGVYYEGIVSHDGFDAVGAIKAGFWQFFGPFPNTYSLGSYGTSTTNTLVKGCTGGTGIIIYAYKTSSNIQFLGSNVYGDVPIVDAAGNPFTPVIEEIEMHPQTGIVYALVSVNNSKKCIYAIDPATGLFTLITLNGGPGGTFFGSTAANGYKGGSIAFVPDGSGAYELAFSHESTVYASSGVLSWRYSLSGTDLTSLPAKSRSYTGIPGTFGTGINTTYGNGKLYFARHGSSNALYSLNLTSNTYTAEGVSIPNTNDFGYWKAF